MRLPSFMRMSGVAVSLAALSAVAQPPVVTPPEAPPSAAVTPPPAPASAAATPAGQWVFTAQYGWLWLPWADSYTWVAPSGTPLMYAYGAELGWTWLAAPWVYGVGPLPDYGRVGPAHFAWYERPWFRLAARAHVTAGPRVFVAGRPFVDDRLHLDRFRDFDRRFGLEGHRAWHPGVHALREGHLG